MVTKRGLYGSPQIKAWVAVISMIFKCSCLSWSRDRISLGLVNRICICDLCWGNKVSVLWLNYCHVSASRPQEPSKKNFQLIPEGDSDNIVLLFGKIARNRFHGPSDTLKDRPLSRLDFRCMEYDLPLFFCFRKTHFVTIGAEQIDCGIWFPLRLDGNLISF